MKKIVVLLILFTILNLFSSVIPSKGLMEEKKPSSYSELVSWYRNLEKNYPQYIEIFKANEIYGFGKIDGGYDAYYVRITNESNGFHKPEVLFIGSPHGDETVGTIGLYWTVKWFMEKIDEGDKWIKWLVDNREIYIEVSHNPYGFDNRQRWDYNEWDLNREADYNWQGYNSELWGSVNGKLLYSFINDHAIRIATDFHGGTRMLLYPWASTHENIEAKSPFSGKKYDYAPPDFYFYHTTCLRVGEYMGDFGGKLEESNIGTIPSTIGYMAPGCLADWGYGGNVVKNPSEDEFVNDEIFGNYDGCGIMWVSPEMSRIKDPPEWQFGDEKNGYISEVIRFVLHQTDLAQPYIRWIYPENNSFASDSIKVEWQVYGCLAVDETYITYSFCKNFSNATKGEIHNDYEGEYRGGTYWDGKIWEEEIKIPENANEIYIQAFARVDGVYKEIVAPDVYGDSFLRIVKERTDENYTEILSTADGEEIIKGNLWWKSPVMHIRIGGISKPKEGYLYVMGKEILNLKNKKTVIIGGMDVVVKGNYERVEFYVDNELKFNDTSPPFKWHIEKLIGKHEIKAVMYYSKEFYEDKIGAWIFSL
ncbi:MAG TPA: hypothetical protein ENI33_00780 [Thermoplasmatales archaeon]|nr:hypothetical protein [Thermoplasmatales archaeon]